MAKNEFLNFAYGIGAAVMDQTTYANQAPLGVVPGIADPEYANKTWHQSALISCAIGHLISSDMGDFYTGQDALDSVDASVLAAQVQNYALAVSNKAISENTTIPHLDRENAFTADNNFTNVIVSGILTANAKANFTAGITVPNGTASSDVVNLGQMQAGDNKATQDAINAIKSDPTIAHTDKGQIFNGANTFNDLLSADGGIAATNITATGNTNIKNLVTSGIDLNGNADFSGTLKVGGASTLAALTTSGTLTSNGITVTKNIDCNGNLDVSGTSALHGDVTSEGTITAEGGFSGNLTGNVTGSVSGNAGTATKLQTARKITVNIGSTTINTFDGSRDFTTGITGTLATSHGGTGRTDGLAVSVTQKFTLTAKGSIEYGKNNNYLADKAVFAWWDGSYSNSHASNLTYCRYGTIVGTTGNQTIGGSKTFSNPVTVATPTAANHAATKDYVDDKVANTPNTDNKMQQNASTANGEYCLLAKSTTATANINGQAIFDADVKLNPSTGTITAKTFKGALSGNATTATTATKANILTTARKITVNVGSTTINTFNGSADVTTGITGTLATSHGGTGRTDGKAASLVTARTISLTGGATGSVSFDGSRNVSMAVTLQTSGGVIPTGCVIAWMGSASKIPSGFLLCNGANVSRTTYKNLYAAIGTTYGAGDGSTTFTLPKLNDGRFLEGSTAPGTKRNAGLPNITGTHTGCPWINEVTGVFSIPSGAVKIPDGTATNNNKVSFSASRSNSIYGSSSTVQPKSLTALFIIKT